MPLTKAEMETVITYDLDSREAICYTCDRSLMRKLDALCEKNKDISLVKTTEDSKTYKMPYKWIKIHSPRVLTDEQRKKASERAKEHLGRRKENE